MSVLIIPQIAVLCGLVVEGRRIRRTLEAVALVQAKIEHKEVLDMLRLDYPRASSAELAQHARVRLLPEVVQRVRAADPDGYEQWLAAQVRERTNGDS